MDRSLYFCLSSSERGEVNLPVNVGRCTEMPLKFLLQSEVAKGLNFMLAVGASAIAAEGKRPPHYLFYF